MSPWLHSTETVVTSQSKQPIRKHLRYRLTSRPHPDVEFSPLCVATPRRDLARGVLALPSRGAMPNFGSQSPSRHHRGSMLARPSLPAPMGMVLCRRSRRRNSLPALASRGLRVPCSHRKTGRRQCASSLPRNAYAFPGSWARISRIVGAAQPARRRLLSQGFWAASSARLPVARRILSPLMTRR